MLHYRITSRTTPTRSLRSGQQSPARWHSGDRELRPSRSLKFNRSLSRGVISRTGGTASPNPSPGAVFDIASPTKPTHPVPVRSETDARNFSRGLRTG